MKSKDERSKSCENFDTIYPNNIVMMKPAGDDEINETNDANEVPYTNTVDTEYCGNIRRTISSDVYFEFPYIDDVDSPMASRQSILTLPSVSELSTILRYRDLRKFAKTFKDCLVDGEVFLSMTPEEFMGEPFNATAKEIYLLKMIQRELITKYTK